MSNQTYQKPMKDAAKRRRSYLCKRSEAGSLGIILTVVSLAFGIVGLALMCAPLVPHDDSPIAGILVATAIIPLYCAYSFGRSAVASFRESVALPYVPPVREQIAALPAEEVLLRGADVPSPTSDGLLRASRNTDSAGEELLRTTEGNGP